MPREWRIRLAGLTLVVLALSPTAAAAQTGAPATARPAPAKACIDAIQGKVAWNRAGTKEWRDGNLALICAGVPDVTTVVAGFEQQTRATDHWGLAIGTCNPASQLLATQVQCSERGKLRSQSSAQATILTFFNTSQKPRSLYWIDFDGSLKSYGIVQPGEEKVQETHVTHPWVITTDKGECVQMFMPSDENKLAELRAVEADAPAPTPAPK